VLRAALRSRLDDDETYFSVDSCAAEAWDRLMH
jgi:hypothetical protein